MSGEADDYAHHVGETRGIQLVIERAVSDLRGLAAAVDGHVVKLFEGHIADDLELDSDQQLSERVDILISYMAANEIGLEDRVGGYRDYLMELLATSDGLPAVFPVSSSPRILDAWIADEVVPASLFEES